MTLPDPPGFRALGERIVHRGYAITVAVGTFAGPDGDEFTRDVVHHPGAVAVAPLHEDGTLTLVRQYRPALDAWLLELPAGIRDVAGEPTVETARRELAEEVGLQADSVEHLVSFHNAPGFSDEEVVVYLATGLTAGTPDAQGPEEQAMQVERHHLDDLATMVADGRLTDAKTVLAVALLQRR